jgi:hypothetical protein
MQRRKLFALFERLQTELRRLFGRLVGINTAYVAIISIAISWSGLSGCASQRIVDSQVSAFSKLDAAPAAGATWRFERLPSQQNLDTAVAARQSKLEAAVAQELAKYGLSAQPVSPGGSGGVSSGAVSYSVQIGARVERLSRAPFDAYEPWGFGLPGRDYVVTGAGRVIPIGGWPRVEQPWYVREVSLIIRDARDNRVVYETQARHEGRWADDEAVLPAMINAALQGFPKPPEGRRMVNVEIAR